MEHIWQDVRYGARSLMRTKGFTAVAIGTIVEGGTHDELVASAGLYAELFKLQAVGYR